MSKTLSTTNQNKLFTGWLTKDPFPSRTDVILNYSELFSMSSGALGVMGATQQMRLNSLFDPNLTGVGHQPYGFDQLVGSLYLNYRVTAVEYEFIFTTPGGSADMICCANFGRFGSIITMAGRSPDAAVETSRCISGHLSPTGSRVCVIKGTMPIHTLVGVPQQQVLIEDDYVGTSTTNPTVVGEVELAVGRYDGGAAQTCALLVNLRYHATIFTRIDQAQS